MLRAMLRPTLFVLAIAIATLLAAVPAAVASVASPPETSASAELKLRANNGLHAELEANDDEVTLEFRRKGRLVSYQVKGEVTEAGLKARFGRLGLIDVSFQPTKTLSENEPPKRCVGEPWTEREGFFTGTIEFSGEREYVRIEVSRAKGTMSVSSEWQCRRRKGPIRVGGTPRRLALSSGAEPEAEPATLSVFSRRCRCGVLAVGVRHSNGRGRSLFYGVRSENREGMEIGRVTFAYAGASTFVFDHAAGTATVRPPPPFSGHATFKRRPRGRDLWRSTIRVPLLGADPLIPSGRSFRATLRRDYPFE